MGGPNISKGSTDISDFSLKRFALKPGEEADDNKFNLVQVVDDCRDEDERQEDATGKYGVCLGLFDWESMTDDDGKILSDDIDLNQRTEDGNPLIRLENGEYIWGIECWFQYIHEGDNFSIDEAQEGVRFLIEWLLPKYESISASNDD